MACVWLFYLRKHSLRYDKLMAQAMLYYDPKREFIFKYGINLFAFNRGHEDVTPEMLQVWNLMVHEWKRGTRMYLLFCFAYLLVGVPIVRAVATAIWMTAIWLRT
jgi:hypothetical protein